MIVTALTILLILGAIALTTIALVRIFQTFSRREKEFTKITVPPAFYRTIDAKTIVETQPMMGLSKTIEEAAADQAAKTLADQIEYDLYRGADAVNEPRPTPPAPPKRKRAPNGMRKTEIPGVYVAKESTSIFARKPLEKSSKKRKPTKKRTKR
jgi:FtsZ-interacting cell division protein ZipA